ncbi:vanadium-dependent haloperoxidase [Micromonospora sp. CB01531]|uniref:vanadium-dependent haloperoxidase n=1 Tax=Micromonospora sp. CB01531 TaxID=1718947 RepID=UPI00093B6EAD|nr:vanadium-dependent haloperoxidase [Micromonospora sp. CB01531]OKI63402.1 phosphoesterase PA-phosphatase [Micromonospora sp. CB01531]
MTLLTVRGWRRGAAGIAAALVAGITATAPAAAATSPVDTALDWYDATAAAIATGTRPQVTNSRAWAISWLAAARAVRTAPTGAVRDYQDAALASAVHTALSTLIPDSAPTLDAALRTTLDRIPDGRAKDRGVAAGQREARSLLAQRAGDGLDPAAVNPPYPTPEPGPGVWQPTPPSFTAAQQAGTRFATPFLLDRADRYRPGPPPALESERYRADLAEVRAYGAADSTVRTPQQTATATFWLGSSLTLYTGILRAALAQSTRPTAWRTSLVAIFHVALVDTQITTSDAKYAYLRWRPVTAIRAGADGDPGWTPLHETPAHPDYPSGHNTYAGAAEQVLTALAGARARASYTITSPSQPGATRTYTDWRRPTEENVDARVWSGIHTRTADEVGVRLGRDVAAYAVRNAARLFA